jgi:uncharacterized protein (DUF58 family)
LRIRAEQTAATLPPLLVAAERVAATVAQGVHGRRRVGQGETFWQFREYEPGEDASRIDWVQSAKFQRLYIRETEWEAAQSVWLWRSPAQSMNYSSAGYFGGDWPSVRERAELILVALASLLVRGGERLTLLGSGLAPMTGRGALTRLVELIELRRPEAPAAAGVPAFEPLPRSGQLVLIGDFLMPLDRIQAAVAQFAGAGLKGHLLQIADPQVEDFGFAGRVRFEGIAEPDEIVISRAEDVRAEYVERFRRHRDGIADIARSVGWTLGHHRTDRPPHLALLALHAALTADRRS